MSEQGASVQGNPAGLVGLLSRVSRRWSHPRVQRFPLQTKEIAGPLQFTPAGTFCWFILGPLTWDYLTLPERKKLWDQQMYRWGKLAESSPEKGRMTRLRVTSRPYPSYEYARGLDADTPNPLPEVEGAQTWTDFLAHGQRRLRSNSLDQRMTAVGLWVGPTPSERDRAELAHSTEHPSKNLMGLIDQILTCEEIMAGPGFEGRRATGRDMAFLLHRSLSMGMPAPVHAGKGGERWEPSDIAEFADRREWVASRFGRTVEIHSEVNAVPTRRHVAVVNMGVMPDSVWPESGKDPWLVASNRLGFPVEWSIAGNLVKGSAMEKTAVFEQNRAEGIRSHYADHKVTPPPAVSRAIAAAAKNVDEVTEGDSRVAGRLSGTIRAAVYGRDADEALTRAGKLIDAYGERLRMPLSSPSNQVQALREMVPGEPRVLGGWTRRMPVGYLASAMPNVDSEVGTETGPYFAYGSGSSTRAARFDLHYGPEQLNASGLFTVSGSQGGGKSFLFGTLAYASAMRGQWTTVLDPSGPLAELAKAPELAPFSRVLDLTSGDPGSLSPYGLIPEPLAENYRSEKGDLDELDFRRAVKIASAERQQLMFDIFRMWLPPSLVRTPGVDVLLREGIRHVGNDPAAYAGLKEGTWIPDTMINPRWVLRFFEMVKTREKGTTRGELASSILSEVSTAAEFPLGELIMPDFMEPVEQEATDDKKLVIVTMPGLTPPPEDVDKDQWGSAERYTQPLLHCAVFATSRFIYGRPRSERKVALLDETSLLARWGSGRAFFFRMARDSRKFNTAVGSASQLAGDHLSLGPVGGLSSSAFVGRIPDLEAAQEGCKVLGVSKEYAPVIQSLSQGGKSGEFMWRDPLGRVGRIRVDGKWHPSLAKYLDTTPGRRVAPTPPDVPPTPFVDPELFPDIDVVPIDGDDEEGAA